MRREWTIIVTAIASIVECNSVFVKEGEHPKKVTPTFSLVEDRSNDGSPSIILTFPNGHSDTLVLEKYYANEDDRRAGTEFCHYIGRLASDPDAYVALTGCPGGAEDVEFTILSQQMDATMFRWTKEGGVELISEHDVVGPSRSRADDDDEFQNDEVVFDEQLAAAHLAVEKSCDEGGCENLPQTMKVSIRGGYGNNFLRDANGEKGKAEERIKRAFCHAQARYCHSASLGTKIQLSLMPEIKRYNTKFTATMDKLKSLQSGTEGELDGAHLMACFGGKDNADRTLGIAFIGSACWSYRNDSKVSITEWSDTDAYLGRNLAHELGHNLGMYHDFDARHGGNGKPNSGSACEGQGTMSYGKEVPPKWSECSRRDLQAHYNQVLNVGLKWCLPVADSNMDCGGNCGSDTSGGSGGSDNSGGSAGTGSDSGGTGGSNSGSGSGNTGNSACRDTHSRGESYCVQYEWACDDDRYAKFRNNCRKTCGVCGSSGAPTCQDTHSGGANYCRQYYWACSNTRYSKFRNSCQRTCGLCK